MSEETPTKRKPGRPKGSVKGYSIARPQNQIRAFPEEWELIKRFAALVRKDPEKATVILNRYGL